MRFKFDKKKSIALRENPKRGIGFEEAQEIFRHAYYLDRTVDQQHQYRAIGWVKGLLHSVIFEIRKDDDGEYYHFVTLYRSTGEEEGFMKKTSKSKHTMSAESIAGQADKGQDISSHFTNKGKMMPPLENLGIDLNKRIRQDGKKT